MDQTPLDKLKDVYSTFAAIFEGREIVIAGGAARDTLRGKTPKDFDIFILNQQFDDWKAFLTHQGQEFKDKLAKFTKVKAEIEWHKSEPFLVESIEYDGAECQFMATPCKTVDELLNTFDWNCAQFSYSRVGFINKTPITKIVEGEYLELNKVTFPYSTLRRGYRFSERFKMRLHKKDILLICGEITKLENEKAKNKQIEDIPAV